MRLTAGVGGAAEAARRLEAGDNYINIHGPWGRTTAHHSEQSGIGRQLGRHGVLAFLEPHSISVPGD